MAWILLCLLAVVSWDIKLFKKLDRGLFGHIYKTSPTGVVVGLILFLLAVTVFSDNRLQDVPFLILITVLPLYFVQRHRLSLVSGNSSLWGQSKRSDRLLSGALGVIMTWIFGVLSFNAFISGILDLFPGALPSMGELLLAAGYSSLVILFLIYRASRDFSGKGFLFNVGLRREGRPWFKVAVLPVLLGLFFAFFSSYWTAARRVQPRTPLNEVLDATQSLDLILIFLFVAVGIAPLIEEIVFRGYFFYVLREWLGGKWAIYIIATTFAFLHVGQYWGDGLAIAMVTLLGFTLTILRAWTGTTLAGVVMHYVYNGGVTVIPIIMLAVSNPAYFEYKAYYPYHDARTKEALLKKSLARQPGLVEAYNDLAWLYAQEEKNLDVALELAEKALQFDPDQPAYWDTKAEILEKLGRFEDAKPIRDRLQKMGE
jgi:membrane protease YdiL (CAAX protease family)